MRFLVKQMALFAGLMSLCAMSGCWFMGAPSLGQAGKGVKAAEQSAADAEAAAARVPDCNHARTWADAARRNADLAKERLEKAKSSPSGTEKTVGANREADLLMTRKAYDAAQSAAKRAIQAAQECAGKGTSLAQTHSAGEDVGQQIKEHHAEP